MIIYKCLNKNCQYIPRIKFDKNNNLSIECIQEKRKWNSNAVEYCKYNLIYMGQNNREFPHCSICTHYNNNYLCCGYCNHCKKEICYFCKGLHKSHIIIPDNILLKANEDLKEFIKIARSKIKEIQTVVNNIEYTLFLYDALSLKEQYAINYEIINNFKNLNIINNIKEKRELFQNATNEIINQLQKIQYLEDIIIEIENKNDFSNSLEKELFQEPKNKLYQKHAIRLENIENKNNYIIKKITNISQRLEKINLDKRDEFLFMVGEIAREAHNYSYKLADQLLEKFYEKNKFNSIIYERAKIEFSAWVNQSLIINSSIKVIKDSRKFFETQSKNYIENNKGYKKFQEEVKALFDKENYYLKDLFRDLCQLYTETLIYSEKNIDLTYEFNCKYIIDKMEDITDSNGPRNVIFTVLPGLFVNNKPISNGKILVYCENKNNILKFNKELSNPKKSDLILKNTIRTSKISKEIRIYYEWEQKGAFYTFNITTDPVIPEMDNPQFSIKLSSNNQELQSSEKNKLYISRNAIPSYDNIYLAVEINGEIIKTNNIFKKS